MNAVWFMRSNDEWKFFSSKKKAVQYVLDNYPVDGVSEEYSSKYFIQFNPIGSDVSITNEVVD